MPDLPAPGSPAPSDVVCSCGAVNRPGIEAAPYIEVIYVGGHLAFYCTTCSLVNFPLDASGDGQARVLRVR